MKRNLFVLLAAIALFACRGSSNTGVSRYGQGQDTITGTGTFNGQPFSFSGPLLIPATATATATPTATPPPPPLPVPLPVVIAQPADGSFVSGVVLMVVSKSSSVQWVNVYVDGKYKASSPPFTFSVDTSSLPNGPHALSAKAYAPGGTQLGQASVTVNVQNAAVPSPTATNTAVPTATPTATDVASPSPTDTPTDVPSPAPTATGAVSSPAPTGTPTAGGDPIPELHGDIGMLTDQTWDTDITHARQYNAPGGSMPGPNPIGLIGGPLLTDAEAASLVKVAPKSSVENGPHGAAVMAANNYFMTMAANNPTGYMAELNGFWADFAASGRTWGGAYKRIDGACPLVNPTEAMVCQWASHKWGVNPLLCYAEATKEANWDQTHFGDCLPGPAPNCTLKRSSGVLQLADIGVNHAFPGFIGAGANLSHESTCFHVDFYMARLWADFHGYTGETPPNDIGADIQSWLSGHVTSAGPYTAAVYSFLSGTGWVSQGYFSSPPPY